MGCFRLPKGSCFDLAKLCALFWEGESRMEKVKLNGLNGRKLCVPIEMGGLKFQDIKLFNPSTVS